MSVNKVNHDADPAEVGRVISLHVQWTKKQIGASTIVQAGKWGDNGGMAIIRANDLVEAHHILAEDPLVQSGLITFELARLYPDVEIK